MDGASASGAVTTDNDVVFSHVDPAKVAAAANKRASSVDEKTFIKTYMDLCKQGKTSEEIAGALGMNVGSMVSRASAMRAAWKKIGLATELPYPKSQRGTGAKSTKMDKNALQAFLESLDGSDNVG
jgi:hypothetical protein